MLFRSLEGKKMEVLELSGRDEAIESINNAINLYEEVFLKD